ncbi:MAG: DUF4406 domain-containing protein [Dehalococcoidia bacterium]|jgi:hypothetical protein
MRIYIAAPLSAPTFEKMEMNADTAIEAGILLMLAGHTPFIPHLMLYVDKYYHDCEMDRADVLGVLDYEDYMKYDLAWLRMCDAILWLSSSPGADRELMIAQKIGLKVFKSVTEVLKHDTANM